LRHSTFFGFALKQTTRLSVSDWKHWAISVPNAVKQDFTSLQFVSISSESAALSLNIVHIGPQKVWITGRREAESVSLGRFCTPLTDACRRVRAFRRTNLSYSFILSKWLIFRNASYEHCWIAGPSLSSLRAEHMLLRLSMSCPACFKSSESADCLRESKSKLNSSWPNWPLH